MKAVYFAWVRERIGKAEEELEPPADGDDRRRSHRLAVAARRRLRACFREAFDHPRGARPGHACSDARIAGAREVAFFPPMTGG